METNELISVFCVFSHDVNHDFLQLEMIHSSLFATSELEFVSNSICRGKTHVNKHYTPSFLPKKPTMMKTSLVFPMFL